MSGNFVIYLIGYIIVVIGVAYGMSAAGLGSQWIVPVVLILAGLGIVYAMSRSQRDTASNRNASTPQQSTQIQNPPTNQGTQNQGTSSQGTQSGSAQGTTRS